MNSANIIVSPEGLCAPTAATSPSEACHELMADVLEVFGEARLCVTGSSMLPSIRPGDVLLIRREHNDQITPGDIVLFARNGRLLTHRIVGAKQQGGLDYLLTRGDALPANDAPISAGQLLGRVIWIARGPLRIDPRAKRSRYSRWTSALLSRTPLLAAFLKCLLHWRNCPPGGVICQA